MAVETQYIQQVSGVAAATLMTPAILIAGKRMLLVDKGVADHRSDLTNNNASVSNRKRSRVVRQGEFVLPQQTQQFQSRFPFTDGQQQLQLPAVKNVLPEPELQKEQSRAYDSAFTSTSGGPLIENTLQLVDSNIRNANMEIDSLIHLQGESLRRQLEDAQKRHYLFLLAFTEQQAVKRIRTAETELEKAQRRNAELEEQLKLLSNENQLWFNAAKNSEIMVGNLRANLEEAILYSSATVVADVVEGCGDNEEILSMDCINDDEFQQQHKQQRQRTRKGSCKVCNEREAGALLLPCRHLCLCRECEPNLSSCPVCGSGKSAGIQVLFNSVP